MSLCSGHIKARINSLLAEQSVFVWGLGLAYKVSCVVMHDGDLTTLQGRVL